MGRLLRVALAGIALALVLAASGQTFPTDAENPNTGTADRHILATCPVGHTCIDLAVSQGDTPDPVPAGDQLTYNIVLQNHGPDDATAVTMTDSLPAGTDDSPGAVKITQDPADPPGTCSFSAAGNSVSCFYPTLENTDLKRTARHISITINYAPTNPPPYPKDIVNSIHVGDDCGCDELNPPTNDSRETTHVTSPGDLALTKWHSTTAPVTTDPAPAPPYPTLPVGQTSFVNLTLENTGAADTLDPAVLAPLGEHPFTVTDNLPAGFQFAGSDSVNNCTATSTSDPIGTSVVTCQPDVVVPGNHGHYTVALLVVPNALSTALFTNTANATKYGEDVTPADNSSSDAIRVGCPAPGANSGLCLTKTDGEPPAALHQGQPFTYRLTVTNENTEVAFSDDIQVQDVLPSGMTVVGTSAPNGSCSVSSGVVTCTLHPPNPDAATLEPGASRSILIQVVEADTGTFQNVACIVPPLIPGPIDSFPLRSGPCAIESSIVQAAGDLAITKTASATTVNVFGQVTYTLTATNNGPAAMPNAVVTDAIQAHLEIVSINPGGPTCGFTGSTDAGGTVSCNLGTIAKGQVKTITIVVSPQAQGTYSNTAKIVPDSSAAAPIDIDLTNNTSNTVTFTANAADLSITKTASPDVVGVGQTLTYTVVVTNNGPGDASGVTVKDPLPTVLSFATATTTTGACSGAQNITCNIGALANGGTAVITIRATPTAPGTVTNSASVTSTSSDLNDANNSASVSNRVIAADLSITKVESPSPVALGIPITYTIKVKNLGPDAATGVTVVDPLPSQVTLATPTASQGTCFGNVTCAIGTLAVNATATITITATPFVPDVTITNTAHVASSFDLNSANNTASVSTQVRQPVLDITPDVGRVGSVPFAVGKRFPPNATVILHWNRGIGRKVVVTNGDGGFRAPMLVFSHDITGLRGLTASPGDPNTPAVAFVPPTAVPFRVLSSTSQPFRTKPRFPGTVIIQRGG